MRTLMTPTQSLPFELGEPRPFGGLTILPLYPQSSSVEYIGLDEAVARGLEIHEVDEHGVVEELHVQNSLDELVLLYEGEELIGAKQNRIVEWTILAEAHSKLTVPVHCVERGRWAYRSQRFAPARHAASPELRRHKRQAEVWAEVSAKSARLGIASPTDAQADLYAARARSLDEYVEALLRLGGQSGALVAIAGEPVCLDFVPGPWSARCGIAPSRSSSVRRESTRTAASTRRSSRSAGSPAGRSSRTAAGERTRRSG